MDVLLFVFGLICVIIGIFGSFLPVLPGPTISWIGILLLYLTKAIENNYWVLGITFIITIFVSVLDYIIPAKGTKKFGGSKYGIWGTNIGMILGLISPIPLGFVIGAFLGAFLGELYFDKIDKKRALKAATGSFLGFLTSSFVKFIVCILYFGGFVYITFVNFDKLF